MKPTKHQPLIVVVLVLSRPTLALRYGTDVADWRRIQRWLRWSKIRHITCRSPCFDWRRIQSENWWVEGNAKIGVVVLVLSRPTLALRYGTDVAEWRRIQRIKGPMDTRICARVVVLVLIGEGFKDHQSNHGRNPRAIVVVLVLSRPTLALRYGTGVAEWRRIQRWILLCATFTACPS